MPPYNYTPLPPGQNTIRMLRLLPHKDRTAPIKCELIEHPLKERKGQAYEALSYVWGSTENPSSIYVNSYALEVTSNLHAALSRLRYQRFSRLLWVDAICIDQKSNVEKEQQIQLMANIYGKAENVIVWLGEEENDSTLTLARLQVAAEGESLLVDFNDTALIALLERPWFRRVWVLQEVGVARSVLVKCGPMEMNGYAFSSALPGSRAKKKGTATNMSGNPNLEPSPGSKIDPSEAPTFIHSESTHFEAGLKGPKPKDGDTAMALFNDQELQEPIDPVEARKLLWKIDFMILPYLAVCYAFFYIDKVVKDLFHTTLSYAAIFGINEDLNLHGTQYSWLSSIFYFGFLAWAFPTNFLMQRLPIGKYLGANIFMWGVFLMIQAACHNFATLAVLRALGGAAEACADPAFMLITSMWYTRREQPVRIGLWYTANGLGIALGGLLGYGIGHIRGALPSWKYEFIVIGALCSAWGIVMFIFLPDSPVSAPGLTQRERRITVERLRDNQTGVENKHLKPYQILEAFLDYKMYFFFILGVVCNVPNGGISNFGTIIIKGFGFSTLVTTLMQVPYGALIALSILACVYLNDRFENRRCVFILIFLIPNIAGAFGLRFVPTDQQVGRLICYYLTGPYNAAFVLVLSMQVANTAGHTKKVVTNAVLFLGYCTGNIAGPFFYKESQKPTYSLGIWSMIVSHLIEAVLISILGLLLRWENKKRDKIQSQMEGGLEGRDLDATAFLDLTDRENLKYVFPCYVSLIVCGIYANGFILQLPVYLLA
ncbi:MFS allantoate transporter [Aspergillus flavus]|uniref:MFS allantoate transporter n=1 Tax=Aspergillus flavus (strain ATCC 200026 / FGSC A1120 / IAM 13836 / NRRL 3357 / JCM 12722 / SRRC 167) TaxID=332952 RepID=A0A7U2N435_ASPFN|nr:MFS allantoate transporter [Aspergillus flavus]